MTERNASKRQHRMVQRLIAALLFSVLLSGLASSQENPSGFNDLILKAAAAREQNNLSQAIDLYRQAVHLNPNWPDGWWFLGSLQYATDSFAPARDALSHYIELNPNAGPAIALRGLCEFETGEYVQSLRDIQSGLSLGAATQPRNAEILQYHEALLLTRNGKFADALRVFGLLAKADAANPDLFEGIGLTGLRTPLLPKEVKASQHELFIQAGEAAFHFMAGDEKVAQQKFQELFQRYPDAANAHYLYGYLLFPRDPDEATEEFKRELEIAPSNAAASLMMAWSSLIRNHPSEALIYAQRVIAEEPAFPSAQLVLGRSLVETGNAKEGLSYLERALQLEPQNLETHIALAKAYSELGRKQDARRERLLCLQLTQNETSQVASP